MSHRTNSKEEKWAEGTVKATKVDRGTGANTANMRKWEVDGMEKRKGEKKDNLHL